MKLHEVVQMNEALKILFVKELPIKASFKLKKIYDQIKNDIENHDEMRKKLFEKYGTQKDGDEWEIKQENIKSYSKEYNELLGLEIDDSGFPKIRISDFGDYVTIEPRVLLALEKVIEE